MMSLNEAKTEISRLVADFADPGVEPVPVKLISSPLLSALRKAGTSHIYADTADRTELSDLVDTGGSRILQEIDGNTANQPLVHKVLARYIAESDLKSRGEALRRLLPNLSKSKLHAILYAMICGRIGNDFVRMFAGGRSWEISLQLHMCLVDDFEDAKEVGRHLRKMVPSALVKVAFTPHHPHCFLLARDLEQEGIPVNFTSTFSARQAVAVALLANVTRTNIFMGRLNQGLHAELLGEHVDLEAQRALLQLRREAAIKTQLIVASMREWQTFVRTAGCDVYTAPVSVIRDFLEQTEVTPERIGSQIQTSYDDRLGIAEDVIERLGRERIARLYRVEPELIEFLKEFRATAEYRELTDGDRLFRRLDEAGFGDLFYAPDEREWQEIRRGKVPDLYSPLTGRIPLDTLYSLLADADFANYQDEMDQEFDEQLKPLKL